MRPGRKHCSEDAQDEVERLILQLAQIRRVTFLKLAVGEAMLLRAPVSGFHHPRSRTFMPCLIPSWRMIG
jgi:hypothetical protein